MLQRIIVTGIRANVEKRTGNRAATVGGGAEGRRGETPCVGFSAIHSDPRLRAS
jgi:hypothetical protein